MEEMEMKKYLFILMVACAAVVACNKNESPAEAPSESNPVKMTLTATIGADTKVSFVDQDNVLKTAWQKFNKVSLLALDVSGNVLSNDIFTAQNDGKTAVFEGEFTNDANTAEVWVFYPALTEGTGAEDNQYRVPRPHTYDQANGVIYGVTKGKQFISFCCQYPLQKKNNDPSDICQYAVMAGKADMESLSEGNMNVALAHKSYVIKATVTFPDDNLQVRSMRMTFESAGRETCLGGYGWTYTYDHMNNFAGGSQEEDPYLCFGDDVDSGTGTGITLDGNTLVAYFTLYACEFYDEVLEETIQTQLRTGDKVSFLVATQSGEYFLDDKEFKKDVILENGKMYRMAATLVKK